MPVFTCSISPTPEVRRVALPGAHDVDHAAIAALTAEALERRAGWIRRALASARPR